MAVKVLLTAVLIMVISIIGIYVSPKMETKALRESGLQLYGHVFRYSFLFSVVCWAWVIWE